MAIDYVAKATELFNKGFRTKSARKDALDYLNRAAYEVKEEFHKKLLASENFHADDSAESKAYWVNFDLHVWNAKRRAELLGYVPAETAVADRMDKLAALRAQMKDAEILPPLSKPRLKEGAEGTRVQYRGHCQCCCRLQAVVDGRMSKHGYEVKERGFHGWFHGVCIGHSYVPVEEDRSVTDEIVKTIRAEVVALNKKAALYEKGELIPNTVETREYDRETGEYKTVPWADAPEYLQQREVERRVWNCQQMARSGTFQADMMERVANEYHGKSLTKVILAK